MESHVPFQALPGSEIVRRAVSRYATAWMASDRQAMGACYHDDFTLHYFGRNPLTGVHRGKAAALTTLGEVTRRTNRKLAVIVDMMIGAERGSLLVREIFSATEMSRRSNACWSIRSATSCCGTAGFTTSTRLWSTVFSPRHR
jgi:ketosteroid isomerase-like protein